jgi:excisionase family DNA binding protein
MEAQQNSHTPARRAYRVKEIVQTFGLSKATIHRLISAGELKAKKVGRITLIGADSVESWWKKAKQRA